MAKIITGKQIEIIGYIPRHKIVKKVVNAFINTEYRKKGKGIKFTYPVEILKGGNQLFIVRPGHKKNFDFKVDVLEDYGIGKGSHKEVAADLRKKKRENKIKFKKLFEVISEIYYCSENDVDEILNKYSGLERLFKKGANVEVILKVIKWLFIMEDIVYWDNEGRSFLYNFLMYASEETNRKRYKEALGKIREPSSLIKYMKKCGIDWIPYQERK